MVSVHSKLNVESAERATQWSINGRQRQGVFCKLSVLRRCCPVKRVLIISHGQPYFPKTCGQIQFKPVPTQSPVGPSESRKHFVFSLSLPKSPLQKKKKTIGEGGAIDPTCINIGRLDRTEPNLLHFKWGSPVNRHSPPPLTDLLSPVSCQIPVPCKRREVQTV